MQVFWGLCKKSLPALTSWEEWRTSWGTQVGLPAEKESPITSPYKEAAPACFCPQRLGYLPHTPSDTGPISPLGFKPSVGGRWHLVVVLLMNGDAEHLSNVD